MSRITVSQEVGAGRWAVWERLADLGDHPTWMADAENLVFTSPATRGVGTAMEVRTRIGPLRTTDRMEVTGWVEGHSIEVTHQGLIEGVGTLAVTGGDSRSTVTWSESLRFPWWLGGGVTAWVARPVLRRAWAGNLRRLAGEVEGAPSGR
jgi:Polyketide cyclase / dehydrase and lipid transport